MNVPKAIPPPYRIFVNRNLRMDSVHAIGFDMDYTLARYKRVPMESLAYRLTLEKLVAKGYPEQILSFVYDPDFVIRGLTVDKDLGNIIKFDRHNHPARVTHGRNFLTQQQRRETYRREKMRFVPPRFSLVDTLFSLPEVCVYADLVAYFDEHPGHNLSYAQIFDDTRQSIDLIHRDDSLKATIRNALETYIDVDPLLPRTLRKLRSSGKQIFLLTNSAWDYTHAVMQFILADTEGTHQHWTDYFDAVVVSAKKPKFFTVTDHFVDLSASLSPHNTKQEHDTTMYPCTKCLQSKAMLFEGGSLNALEHILNMHGEEVLYVGDHIYGDILRSKKTSLWRTALIVEELEEEMQTIQLHHDTLRRIEKLENTRQHLDTQLNILRQHLSNLDRQQQDAPWVLEQLHTAKHERHACRVELFDIINQLKSLESQISDSYNANWGLIFKEDRENSRFGDQVGDYACIYTSRVSNFLNYSSYQFFRSPRDQLPHERDFSQTK